MCYSLPTTHLLFSAMIGKAFFSFHSVAGWTLILLFLIFILLVATLYLYFRTTEIRALAPGRKAEMDKRQLAEYISTLDKQQIDRYLENAKPSSGCKEPGVTRLAFAPLLLGITQGSIWGETGVLIMLVLLLLPVLAGIVVMIFKVGNILRREREKQRLAEAKRFSEGLSILSPAERQALLTERRDALGYGLTQRELIGELPPEDKKGLLSNVTSQAALTVVPLKKRAVKRPPIDPALARLVLAYIGCATFWLVVGTTVGEYLGIKFVAPDADHVSWLSFGRLRPVHTNMVFWGWASLGMLGLGYYIVPRVGNNPLASLRKGWYSLWLINAAVLFGSLCLMGGINNAGGEYREYIWPVMALFAIALMITLINFLQTIGRRKPKEIYISNWYIVAAIIFGLVIVTVGYLPFWQDGLGETIVQGYYMHQAVGMWFMMFTLGIVYYFLPQQLNRPIYSYSLGILAFWTQILFYTVIGTHHFIFSSIPWWLQTFAIVGSVGMIIPVAAGTTNFILTFKGGWHKLSSSYTLPFFLVGVVFYFTGSMQGTAEAFRSTNLFWHFTDFTVAHSHLTMYGIISFFLWAGMYAVVPRLTGREPPQILVGTHFWMALIGLLFYTVPLMYGGTLKGLLWIAGKPFIEGVTLMEPYWLWRAIGGSLMWLSHFFFAYNLYKMTTATRIKQKDYGILQQP
jgi:cytochrome c oxidase cbb3-type subunit 1